MFKKVVVLNSATFRYADINISKNKNGMFGIIARMIIIVKLIKYFGLFNELYNC